MIIKHEHMRSMLQDTISTCLQHIVKLSDEHSEISEHYRSIYTEHLNSMIAHLEEVKQQYMAESIQHIFIQFTVNQLNHSKDAIKHRKNNSNTLKQNMRRLAMSVFAVMGLSKGAAQGSTFVESASPSSIVRSVAQTGSFVLSVQLGPTVASEVNLSSLESIGVLDLVLKNKPVDGPDARYRIGGRSIIATALIVERLINMPNSVAVLDV